MFIFYKLGLFDYSFNAVKIVFTILTRGMFVKTVFTVVKTVAVITGQF